MWLGRDLHWFIYTLTLSFACVDFSDKPGCISASGPDPSENHLAWSRRLHLFTVVMMRQRNSKKRMTKSLKWDARKILMCPHCVNNVFGCYRLEWLNDWDAKRSVHPSLALHAECSGSDFSVGHVKASSLLPKLLQQNSLSYSRAKPYWRAKCTRVGKSLTQTRLKLTW